MQADEARKFYQLLTATAELFDRALTPTTLELYFAALADLDYVQIERAIQHTIRAAKFFPRPAEIREACEGTADDRAQAAWETVVRAIRRFGGYRSLWLADAVLADAIRETWGGWVRACETLPLAGDPMFVSDQKRFLAAFRLAERKPAHGDQYLPGAAECRNRSELSGVGALLTGHTQLQLVGGVERPVTEQISEEPLFQIVGVVEGDGTMHERRLAFSRTTGALLDTSRALLTGQANEPQRLRLAGKQ